MENNMGSNVTFNMTLCPYGPTKAMTTDKEATIRNKIASLLCFSLLCLCVCVSLLCSVLCVSLSKQDTVAVRFFHCFRPAKPIYASICWTIHPCVWCASISCNANHSVFSAERDQKPRKTKKTKKKQNDRTHVPVSKTSKSQKKQNDRTHFPVSRTSKNQKKQKDQKGRTYVPVSGIGSVLLVFWFFVVKPKKKAEPMSQYLAWGQYFWFFLFFWLFEAKPKKKGRTYVPVSGMGPVLLIFLVFLVFRGKTKKTKKTKRQNLCPSIWHGVILFIFLVFLVFRGKTKKKNKKAEPMSQYLAWGQYFWFFCFFLVFRGKTKKTKKAESMSQYLAWGPYFWFFWFFEAKPKKTKRQNLCPSIWHGANTFVFWFFEVKPKKPKKKKKEEPISQYLAWGHYFWFFGFSRFLQYSGIWHEFCNFAFLFFQGFCNIRPFLIRL